MNMILGWISFIIALVVYTLTLEPSVSLWDCGEFISASYRLQVVHPPGAPLFLMLGKFFTLFASPGTNEVAIAVNMLSAVASAATVMLTFWITVHFAKKIKQIGLNEDKVDLGNALVILGAGLVAALSVTFMDTFWFSAVEAEVYAASSCFMALAFWAILRWERVKDEKTSDRWLVFVAYVVGMGIGLHLLNLLVIPAIILYYFFNKYEYSRSNLFKAAGIGLGTIAILQWIIIPKTPAIAAIFDRMFVNGFGLPFNSGVLFFMALIGGLTAFGLWYTRKNAKPIANLVLLCFAFIMLGFSSYSMIVIRSLADPAIDMNDPEDAHSLLSYINREQYGERPLVKGHYWNARLYDIEEGAMQYRKGENGYEETKPKQVPVYEESYTTMFPRMSDVSEKSQLYPLWAGMDEVHRGIENIDYQLRNNRNLTPEKRQELQQEKARLQRVKPTSGENMTFMFRYQIGWMYMRYFMWNFVGRQNDNQNIDGNLLDGNWLSGISFIDNMRLGPQEDLPDYLNYHKARNTYYFLPLILGILGLLAQYKQSKFDFYTVLVMFVFTGILVVVYLNQPPMEPRERDYTNVGSYQTFCIWIGLSVLFLADLLKKYLNAKTAAGVATALALLAAPVLMASENWDDHDRSDRYLGISFAKNYLESCDENAILFTNGDNDTYPLWYAQNVEGIRTDVRIINLSLLPTEWYSDALRRKVFESEPLPMSIPAEKMVKGKREYIRFAENKALDQSKYYPLDDVLAWMTSDDNNKMTRNNIGEIANYYPVKNFSVDIDSAAMVASGRLRPQDYPMIVDKMQWNIGRNGLSKGDIVVLDIIATNARTGWQRPIYWTTTTGSSVYLNLDKYLRHNGLTYELLPVEADRRFRGMDDMNLLYDNLMNKYVWGNMENGDMFLDDKATLVPKNLRSLFVQVADFYSRNNSHDSAVALVEECYRVMPESILPMDPRLKIASAEVYYRADMNEKGDKLLDEVGEDMGELVAYFKRFSGNKRDAVIDMARFYLSVLGDVSRTAESVKSDEIAKKYQLRYNQLATGL